MQAAKVTMNTDLGQTVIRKIGMDQEVAQAMTLYGFLMGHPQETITAICMPEAVTNKKFYYSEYTAIFKILSALFSKIS